MLVLCMCGYGHRLDWDASYEEPGYVTSAARKPAVFFRHARMRVVISRWSHARNRLLITMRMRACRKIRLACETSTLRTPALTRYPLAISGKTFASTTERGFFPAESILH